MKLFLLLGAFFLSTSSNAQITKKHIVLFEFGSSTVSEKEKEDLSAFVLTLDREYIVSIDITGFADDIGPAQLNKEISTKRAIAARKALLQFKLPQASKIKSTKGMGSIPLTSLENAEKARSENRRVELIIVTDPPPLVEVAATDIIAPPQPKPLFTAESAIGEKIELHNILFEPGSSDMYPQSKYELDRLHFYLKKYENIHILIEGHICCQPDGRDGIDDETGLRNLSEARARAVHYYLVTKGIEKERLDFKGMKGNFPLGLGDKSDRRVEIKITKN